HVRHIGSSYGDIVTSFAYDADGFMLERVYGDAAHTTTSTAYDGLRRVSSVQTYRATASAWSAQPPVYSPAPSLGGAPPTLPLLLEALDFTYDAADNPTMIRDWRSAAEWPAGAQPVTRKMQYDGRNRLTRIDYQYPNGSDIWVDPFAAESAGTSP